MDSCSSPGLTIYPSALTHQPFLITISMNWLDIAGTSIGLVYIYQEYKASIRLWVTGLIMPMV